MKPLNRRLLIEVINQEEEKSGAFFIPEAEKSPDEYTVALVIDCAEDCGIDMTGQRVVFTTFGIETVTVAGKQYNFIGENHLICVK